MEFTQGRILQRERERERKRERKRERESESEREKNDPFDCLKDISCQLYLLANRQERHQPTILLYSCTHWKMEHNHYKNSNILNN